MTLPRLPLLALLLLLTACPSTELPEVTIKVDPASLTIAAGAVPQAFTATVAGSSANVNWTLAGPGSLEASTGTTTRYVPPPSVPSTQTATLKATVSGSSTTATITVTPVSTTAGNLSIYLDGLEEPGATGAVAVSGPGGYSATLTGSRTLLDLDPGSYTVDARAVRVRQGSLEALRRPELDCPEPNLVATSCTVVVGAGETARVHVTYLLEPSSGRLYIPSYFAEAIAAYPASQLSTSNSEPPTALLEGTPGAQSVAIDLQGNLWVSDWNGNALRRYGPGQLVASGTPTPEVILTYGGLYNPTGQAFDADGNLWVTNRGNSTVTRYGPDQLAASSTPTPAATLGDDGSNALSGPTGITFDAEGRLWFANAFSNLLFRYDDPSALMGDSTAPPDAAIGSAGFASPTGLAFDADGNLWVSDSSLNTLLKFTPDQLEASGSPAPTVTISGLASPGGLALDAVGNLWLANGDSTVVAFTPEQLSASGSPSPEVALMSGFGGIDLGFLAFNPPPSGLPLAQPAALGGPE